VTYLLTQILFDVFFAQIIGISPAIWWEHELVSLLPTLYKFVEIEPILNLMAYLESTATFSILIRY